jgi:hypothetical protein
VLANILRTDLASRRCLPVLPLSEIPQSC